MRLDREEEERALVAEYEREWMDCGDEEGALAPEWVTQRLPIDPALDELVPVWEEEEVEVVEIPEAAIEDTVPVPSAGLESPGMGMQRIQWRSEVVRWPVEGEVVGVAAASHEDRPRFFAVTRDGRLSGVDLDHGAVFFEATLPFTFTETSRSTGTPDLATLVSSANGRYLAAVQTRGLRGALFDVERGTLLHELERADYHAEVSAWAIAFVRARDADVLVLATAWNRLEAFSLPGFERLAPDAAESSVDYFLGHASLSPSGRWLASFGWHWHPIGALRVYDVEAWLRTKVDPPPAAEGTLYTDWWDEEVLWLDDDHYVTAGQATPIDDVTGGLHERQEGLLVVERETGTVQRFLPGLAGRQLALVEGFLIVIGEVASVVSLSSGALRTTLNAPVACWHPGARLGLSLPSPRTPAAAHWLTGYLDARPQVGLLSLPSHAGREELHVLGDALEESGAASHLAEHCRAGGTHGRRCWVVEGLRGARGGLPE